jgi:hypothetical protein
MNAEQISSFNAYRNNLRQSQRNAIAQNNAATQAAIQQYRSLTNGIRQTAEDQARAAYIQRLRSTNALPRLLQAQGINGGAVESTFARMSSGFDNAHSNIMRNRNNALLDIDSRIAAARMRGAENAANIRREHSLQRMYF